MTSLAQRLLDGVLALTLTPLAHLLLRYVDHEMKRDELRREQRDMMA